MAGLGFSDGDAFERRCQHVQRLAQRAGHQADCVERPALPTICAKLNWDVNDLPFTDFSWAVADWISNNPIP